MRLIPLAVGLFLAAAIPSGSQTGPGRSIDLCAQDGDKFYEQPALEQNETVTAGKLGDLLLTVRYLKHDSTDATLRFSRDSKTLFETTLDDFQGPYGWLTVGDNRHFAMSWSPNAGNWSTKIFSVEANDAVTEDEELMKAVERSFADSARSVCSSRTQEMFSEPGFNVRAIKWIDTTHLLLAANSWSSFTCQANFDEGFIVEPAKHSIERVLSGRELIDLPAVCTWNLAPVRIRSKSGATSPPR